MKHGYIWRVGNGQNINIGMMLESQIVLIEKLPLLKESVI